MTSEKVLVYDDFDGHVGSEMGGFGEVHGWFRRGSWVFWDWANK